MRAIVVTIALVLSLASAEASAAWDEQMSLAGDGNENFGVALAPDCLHGFVMGKQNQGSGDQLMYYTSEDGSSWAPQQAASMFEMVLRAAFVNDTTLFAAGMGLYKSGNGGKGLTKVNLPAGSPSFFTDVYFLPGTNYGWAVGDGAVVKTTDTMMWSLSTLPDVGCSPTAVTFFNTSFGMVVGGSSVDDPDTGESTMESKGCMFLTTDGGATWDIYAQDQPESYYTIAFLSAFHLFVAGATLDETPFLRESKDGGQTWADVAMPAHPSGNDIASISKVAFPTALDGWVVGSVGYPGGGFMNDPLVMVTHDGGDTWTHDTGYDGSAGSFYDVSMCNEHIGLFIGDYGAIVRYDDGSFVPGEESVTEWSTWTDAIGPDAGPGPWSGYLGPFAPDGGVYGAGQVPVDPTGDTIGGGDGGISVPGGQTCVGGGEECEGGCAMGSRGEGAAGTLALVVVAILVGVGLRSRGGAVALLVLFVAAVGCGEECTKVEPDCTEAAGDASTVDFSFVPYGDTAGDAQITGYVPEEYCRNMASGFDWDELTDELGLEGPAVLTDSIVFVRSSAGGGSDLWLVSRTGGDPVELTRFGDASVDVWGPAWSPNRRYVSFVSTFNQYRSTHEAQLYLVKMKDGRCAQVAPEGGVFEESSAAIGGFFKYTTGALDAPVPGAFVASTKGTVISMTDNAGTFTLDVPAGSGTLVIRGTQSGISIAALVPYEVSAADQKNLGDVAGDPQVGRDAFVEAFWTADGASLMAVEETREEVDGSVTVAEVVETISLVDQEVTAELDTEGTADWAGVTHFAHSGSLALVSTPEEGDPVIKLYDPTAGTYSPSIVAGSLAPGARVASSPAKYLAVAVDEDVEGTTYRNIVVIGATNGYLDVKPVTSYTDTAIVPDELSWSPDGTSLVFVRADGDDEDLFIVDVNGGTPLQLTYDGASSDPAWY